MKCGAKRNFLYTMLCSFKLINLTNMESNTDIINRMTEEYGYDLSDNVSLEFAEALMIEKEKQLRIGVVSSSFFENLLSIPNEINGYELMISKEDDGTWVVVYETNFGYLKAKNDRHNECIHSNLKLEKAIKETLEWIQNYC